MFVVEGESQDRPPMQYLFLANLLFAGFDFQSFSFSHKRREIPRDKSQGASMVLGVDQSYIYFCVAAGLWMLLFKKHTMRNIFLYFWGSLACLVALICCLFPIYGTSHCVNRLHLQKVVIVIVEWWHFRRCFVRRRGTFYQSVAHLVELHCRFAVFLLLKGWSYNQTHSDD